MRRSLAAVTAALGLGITGLAIPVVLADPGACDTAAAPRPFPAPDGTTFVAHYSEGSDGSRITSSVLEGVLPDGCVIDGLGYDRTDGFLYALHNQSIVQIGRDADGELAVETVGALPGTPLGADVDRSGNYVTLDVNPLTASGTVQTYPDVPAPIAEVFALQWAPSCDPLLNNHRAQARLRLKDPRLPQPESLINDLAYNPADGLLYAYAAIDATDAYLGKTEPIGKWTVSPLPDQVIRVDPSDGSARCAPASNPHPPGGVDRGVIGDTYGFDALHGSAAVAGAAFTSQNTLVLYQLAQGRQWRLDVGGCFTDSGCVPEPDGSAPDGVGDAAGNPYQPARMTVETIVGQGSAPPPRQRQRFSFPANDLDPRGFALAPGESRTFDLAPGEVELAKAPTIPGWQLEHTGCRTADAPIAQRLEQAPMRVMLRPGEQLVCTYAARLLAAEAVPSASTEAGSTPKRENRRGESTAIRKASDERSEIEFTLPWNGQTAVSLPVANTTAVAAVVLVLALCIGGGVFVLFPPRRRNAPPPYRARHRA